MLRSGGAHLPTLPSISQRRQQAGGQIPALPPRPRLQGTQRQQFGRSVQAEAWPAGKCLCFLAGVPPGSAAGWLTAQQPAPCPSAVGAVQGRPPLVQSLTHCGALRLQLGGGAAVCLADDCTHGSSGRRVAQWDEGACAKLRWPAKKGKERGWRGLGIPGITGSSLDRVLAARMWRGHSLHTSAAVCSAGQGLRQRAVQAVCFWGRCLCMARGTGCMLARRCQAQTHLCGGNSSRHASVRRSNACWCRGCVRCGSARRDEESG